MRSALTFIGFTLVAIALYVLWGNLSARIVAIESDTGSYIYTDPDIPETTEPPVQGPDVSGLRDRLASLETLQRENSSAIEVLSGRLDRFEASICRGEDCGRKVLTQEAVFFGLNESMLTKQAKDRIDRVLEDVGEGALISLRGQTDAIGDEAYNYLLSLRRAAAVKRYIDTKFGAAGQSNSLLITIDGTGEALAGGAGEEEDPARRVVEILVLE
jgi:outer membrane protein OmpA-like peptidoglycan-associated protein